MGRVMSRTWQMGNVSFKLSMIALFQARRTKVLGFDVVNTIKIRFFLRLVMIMITK